MHFIALPTTQIFDFIGIYLPMIIILAIGIFIAKCIHHKLPVWIMYILGIGASILKMLITFEVRDYSTVGKIIAIVLLLVVVTALGIAAGDVHVEKKPKTETDHSTKICQYCGHEYTLGTSCPKCGARDSSVIK